MPTLAPEPAKKRPTTIMGKEFPTGHMAFQSMYHVLRTNHTGLRPYTLDSAAMGNGAKASPRMKMEKVICVVVSFAPTSRPIWLRADAIIDVDMSVMSCPKETMTDMRIFRLDGQL